MNKESIQAIAELNSAVVKEAKKQAVKEAFEKLKEESVYFAGAEYVDVRAIDQLFTELYGAEE